MDWGRERHSRGNLGEGLDPQERQGTIVGEGERRRGRARYKSISLHTWTLQMLGCLWCRLRVVRGYLLVLLETGHLLCWLQVAAATAKCSRHCLNLPEAHYHFPGPCN